MARRFQLSAAAVLLAVLTGACTTTLPKGPPDNIWDGIYTGAQADRGAVIYAENCESCHAANMRGGPGVKGLVGPGFQYLWDGHNLGELFDYMRVRMPPGKAGLLTDQEYIDVMTAILRGNDITVTGTTELTPEHKLLDGINIAWDRPE